MADTKPANTSVSQTATLLPTQTATVDVTVDATAAGSPLERVWPYHGFDEVNYATTPDGKSLLAELAAAHTAPVHVRTHFLLNTGNGTPSLKWGSTNVYTEDAAGNPVYSWTLMDGIMDAITGAGALPLVEIAFMPQALSTQADPVHELRHLRARRRLLLPAQGLRQVEQPDQSLGDARKRALSERREQLAVGAVERARHRLLARHVRRLREALRLHRGGRAPGAAERAGRRAGGGVRRR